MRERKGIGPHSHALSEYVPMNTPEYTPAPSPPYLYLIYFLQEMDRGINSLATASGSLWAWESFVFLSLTSVTFQLPMLKGTVPNITYYHGRFPFILLFLLSLYNLASLFPLLEPKYVYCPVASDFFFFKHVLFFSKRF